MLPPQEEAHHEAVDLTVLLVAKACTHLVSEVHVLLQNKCADYGVEHVYSIAPDVLDMPVSLKLSEYCNLSLGI